MGREIPATTHPKLTASGKLSQPGDPKARLLQEQSRELRAAKELARRPFVQEYLDFGMLVDDETPRSFLCLLPRAVFGEGRLRGREGRRIRQLSASGLRRRGVREGDRIYVAAYVKGQLFLVGESRVRAYVGSGTTSEWPGGRRRGARDHVACSGGTQVRLSRRTPEKTVRQLEILELDGRRNLLVVLSEVDAKRGGVFELHPVSARRLDALVRKAPRRNRRPRDSSRRRPQ